MEKDGSAAQILEYSPRPGRRKKIVRRIVLVFLLVGAASALIAYREPIRARGREIYWIHRCMTHVTPVETVLVEIDPIKAGVLIKNNEDYVDAGSYLPPNSTMNSIRSALSLRAAYVPRELKELEKIFSFQPASYGESTLYLGPIRTPSGKKRLLVLRSDGSTYPRPGGEIAIDLLESPSFTQGPRRISLPVRAGFNDDGHRDYVWFHSGTLDPNDPAHVMVPFEVITSPDASARTGKFSGVLDIRISDANTLSFTERGKPEQARVR